MRHDWTKEDIKLLEELYPITDNVELSKLLNLSITCINAKANKLNIYKQILWTTERIEQLIKIYPDNTNIEIAKIMGLTEKQIKNKSAELKLKKSKELISINIGKRNKLVGRDLNFETLKEIASKYKTRGEFQRLDGSAYTTARVNGILDDICTHMVSGNFSIPQLILYCILDHILESEIIYNTKKIIPPYELDIFIPVFNLAFEYDGKGWHEDNKNDELKNKICETKNITLIRLKENNRDYIKDVKEQIIENITLINNITKLNINIKTIFDITDEYIYDFVNNNINDDEDIINIINKYTNYSDFKSNEPSLYQKLLRRGILEKYTSNLIRKYSIVDIESIKEEVMKYEYLLDFIEKSPRYYSYCKRYNLEYLFEKLKRKNSNYNIADVENEILKYVNLYDFRKQSPKYYSYIIKHKLNYLLDIFKNKNRD